MAHANRHRNERRDGTKSCPTQAAIHRRAAMIRASWSDDERARRREISQRVAQFWELVLSPCGE
ncbi:MAG TPA: hypothetical protein VHV55_04120 [Pirellulales bacterium]|jgi:hypothetical protein|nr:hypothetical protein [Pirellulales bacterium]